MIEFTGFMKHLPNLLKQETSSAATLVHVLLRMYFDIRPDHQAARPQIAERLVPYVFYIGAVRLITKTTEIGLVLVFFETSLSSKLKARAKISWHGPQLWPKSLMGTVDWTVKM